mgnify:CR=1 FL=1
MQYRKGHVGGNKHPFYGLGRGIKVPKALGAEGLLAIVDHKRFTKDALLIRSPGVGLISAA